MARPHDPLQPAFHPWWLMSSLAGSAVTLVAGLLLAGGLMAGRELGWDDGALLAMVVLLCWGFHRRQRLLQGVRLLTRHCPLGDHRGQLWARWPNGRRVRLHQPVKVVWAWQGLALWRLSVPHPEGQDWSALALVAGGRRRGRHHAVALHSRFWMEPTSA